MTTITINREEGKSHFDRALQLNNFGESCSLLNCRILPREACDIRTRYYKVCSDRSLNLVIPVRFHGSTIVDVAARAFDPSCFGYVSTSISPIVFRELEEILSVDVFKHDEDGYYGIVARRIAMAKVVAELLDFLKQKSLHTLGTALGMYVHLTCEELGLKSQFFANDRYVYLRVEGKYEVKVSGLAAWNHYLHVPAVRQNMMEESEEPDTERSVGNRIYTYTTSQLNRLNQGVSSLSSSVTSTITSVIETSVTGIFDAIYDGIVNSRAVREGQQGLSSAQASLETLYCRASDFLKSALFKSLVISVLCFVSYKVLCAETLSLEFKLVVLPLIMGGMAGIGGVLGTEFMREVRRMNIPGRGASFVTVSQNEGKVTPVTLTCALAALAIIGAATTDEKHQFNVFKNVNNLTKVAGLTLATGTLLQEIDFSAWMKLLPLFVQEWLKPDVTVDPEATYAQAVQAVLDKRHQISFQKRGTVIEYLTACDEVMRIVRRYPDLLKKPGVSNLVTGMIKECSTFRTLYGPGAAKRKGSFWIYLYGKQGIGKSVLIDRIAKYVNHYIYNNNYTDIDLMYPRNSTNYWDRYYHQPIVYMDDLGCTKDDPRIAEVHNICADLAYTLDMASLESEVVGKKGTTYSSELLITSSNHYSAASQATNLTNRAAWDSKRNVTATICFVGLDGKLLTQDKEVKKLYFADNRFSYNKAYTLWNTQTGISADEFDRTMPCMRVFLAGNSLSSVPDYTKTPNALMSVEVFLTDILNRFEVHRTSGRPNKDLRPKDSLIKTLSGKNRRVFTIGDKYPSPVNQNGNSDSETEGDYFSSTDDDLAITAVTPAPSASLYEGGTDDFEVETVEALLNQPEFEVGIEMLETQSRASTIWSWLKTIMKITAAFAAMAAFAQAAASLYSSFNAMEDPEQNSAHNERNSRRADVIVRQRAADSNKNMNFVRRSGVSVSVQNGHTYNWKGSGLGYGGYVIMPRHFIIRGDSFIPKGTEILIRNGMSTPITELFDKDRVVFFENDDGSPKDIIAFPVTHTTFRSTLSAFPKKDKLGKVSLQSPTVGGYQLENG